MSTSTATVVLMTFAGLLWANTGATDLHLLPGLVGPDLKSLLRASDGAAAAPLDNTFTVRFTESLNGSGASHGATVNPDTGEVTVTTAAMKGRSFILTASATQAGVTRTTRIRVNIHNAITRMWLTPAPRLTVRNRATGVRFSVLALFDDGLIGDITNWSPFEPAGAPHTFVHADGADDPALTWSSTGPPVVADPRTGVLTASADTGEATITVRHDTVPPAAATAVCARAWTTPVSLTHVGGPGVRFTDSVPNILFLPDGFTDTERGRFENLVRLIVKRLEYRNRTRPFAALVGRMNYWQAWVPSPQPGVSVLNEVEVKGGGGSVDKADGVPFPTEGPATSLPKNRWEISDLVNAVGLPNPVADPIISSIDAKIAEWQRLYGTFVTGDLVSRGPDKPGGVSLFGQWLSLADRTLIDERDTAFHTAFGNRPALAGDNVDHAISLNPRRLTDDDFNSFLDALRGPHNENLGRLWTTGKDRTLVVMVCRSSHVGGSTSERDVRVDATTVVVGRTIGVSLATRNFHQLRPSTTGGGNELVPDNIPTDVFYSVWLTVTHELGHAAGLGDEAGGATTPPTAREIADAATRPNVQDVTPLVSPGVLHVDKIKWAGWQRIAKAGVVKAIAPQGGPTRGPLTVTLDSLKKSGLAKDDIVRLRRRPLATAGDPSPIWRVDSVTPAQNQVVIVPQFAGPTEVIDPAAFPPGSILMAPVRAAGTAIAEKTLADPEILTRIATTRNPLNAQPLAGEADKPNDVEGRPTPNVELDVPTLATNFPNRKAPEPPAFSSWTIGVFENGGRHNTGFYRPTGTCLMSAPFQTDPRHNTVNLYDFCLICRYAFIDGIDPTAHGQVEQDFVERYGKQGAR